jgi:PBP1b-binding outer membrane lipoprotein LpoB
VKKRKFIAIAFAPILVLAGCEQKTEPTAQTTPSQSPAPSPSPSATATPTPASTPSTPAPAPLKSPADTPAQSPSAANGNARPSFSSQSANEYVQSYDAYISDFKQAYEAMKQGDMTKYQAVIQRAHELESKGGKLGGELSPEEQARFADYLNKKADELAQFTRQNH